MNVLQYNYIGQEVLKLPPLICKLAVSLCTFCDGYRYWEICNKLRCFVKAYTNNFL